MRLRDLVALVGADPDDTRRYVESLRGRAAATAASTVDRPHPRDPLTADRAAARRRKPLHLDHGYPARLIAPNRPGVLQTKWVARITVDARP